MTSIRNRLNMRAIALIMVVAIAGSGLASMAALTGQLTVTSTFAGAQILVSGNGTTGSATLFNPNQIMVPGEDKYASLEVKNVGNIAATFSYLPPQTITGTGNLADLSRVTVYNPQTTQWAIDNAAALPGYCADGSLTGWDIGTPQTAYGTWLSINVSAFNLNPNQSRLLCYKATLPADAVLDTGSTMTVVQNFTGNQ